MIYGEKSTFRFDSSTDWSFCFILLLSGKNTQTFAESLKKTEDVLSGKKMLHLRQVIEYYDSEGKPVPRYFELFVAKGIQKSTELDSEGNEMQIYLDKQNEHISYDPVSLAKQNYEANPLILPDLALFAKDKALTITKESCYEYAGQSCASYMISNGNPQDDIRVYLDDATGFILFCDAPLFCIKTASIEVIPYDAAYFKVP